MNVLIRKAEKNDVTDLANLMGELGYPTTIEEMEARFSKIYASPFYNTFVAEVNGNVAGMIGMICSHHYEKNDDYIRIVAFIVDSNYRRKGIGKKLLLETEKWAKENGIYKLVLNSGNRNERDDSHVFYKRRGFEGKATGFYKVLN